MQNLSRAPDRLIISDVLMAVSAGNNRGVFDRASSANVEQLVMSSLSHCLMDVILRAPQRTCLDGLVDAK